MSETERSHAPTVQPGMYVKRPIPVRADRWWKNGDHPDDRVGKREIDEAALLDAHPELLGPDGMVGPVPEDAPTFERLEGAVVRFYRHPDVPGDTACKHCGRPLHVHGWIETLEGGHIVCPGDVIITGVRGERYPCKAGIFAETYAAAKTVGTVRTEWVIRRDDGGEVVSVPLVTDDETLARGWGAQWAPGAHLARRTVTYSPWEPA